MNWVTCAPLARTLLEHNKNNIQWHKVWMLMMVELMTHLNMHQEVGLLIRECKE